MIIELDSRRPHKVSEVICVACCKRWIAARPDITLLKELECPECHERGAVIPLGMPVASGSAFQITGKKPYDDYTVFADVAGTATGPVTFVIVPMGE